MSKGHIDIAEERLSTRLLVGHGKKVKFRGIFRDKLEEKMADFTGNSQKFLEQILLKSDWWKMANFVRLFLAHFAGKQLVLHWFDKPF